MLVLSRQLAQVTQLGRFSGYFRRGILVGRARERFSCPKPDVVKTYPLESLSEREILMAVEVVTVGDHRCSYDGANAGRVASSTPTGL